MHRLQGAFYKAVKLNFYVVEIGTGLGDRTGKAYALLRIAHIHRNQNFWSNALCFDIQVSGVAEQISNEELKTIGLEGAADARRMLQSQEAPGELTSTFQTT